MGLLGDIKEAQKEWKGKGMGYKFLVILSLYFTVSSLTSLSESIFKWKGFIKDGLEFYRKQFSIPLSTIINDFGLKVSLEVLDSIIFYSLIVIPELHIAFSQELSREERVAFTVRQLSVSFIVGVSFIYLIMIRIPIWANMSIIVAILVFMYVDIRFLKSRVYIIRSLSAIAIIFILAAINKGLNM